MKLNNLDSVNFQLLKEVEMKDLTGGGAWVYVETGLGKPGGGILPDWALVYAADKGETWTPH
ncbi:MAG: hypothetical protein JXR68_07210 [Bacteroidales bacterium]|nr:hypothetical protein [Bacteroidales bacterium]